MLQRLLSFGLLSAALFIASPVRADLIYSLNEDGCSGGCGAAPFGTIDLAQTDAFTVTITETLNSNTTYAGKNGTGIALAFNISSDPSISISVAPGETTEFSSGGSVTAPANFGSFEYSVLCIECQGGQQTNPSGPLTFSVMLQSSSPLNLNAFSQNNKGTYFYSDIAVTTNGKTSTGPVASDGPAVVSTPEPLTLFLFGTGLLGIAVLKPRLAK